MIERQIAIDGQAWTVSIAGRYTVYERDEFTVVFTRRDAAGARAQARHSEIGTG